MCPRLRLSRVVVCLFAACFWLGCGRDVCEPGACPVGTSCNAQTGLCEKAPTQAASVPGVLGHLSMLRLPGGQLGVVAHAPDRKSLLLLTGHADHWQASFIAGPSAAPDDAPAGQASAAVADAEGRVHVAWVRGGDATLWYASGGSTGWQRDPQPLAAPGTMGRDVAIGLWQGAPVVAWRSTAPGGLHVSRRQAGQWTDEIVPPPVLPGQPSASVDEGHGLSLAMLPSGPALVSYEAHGGDLVLAVRSGTAWNVARIAGRDPATGWDAGDMGATAASAVGQAGELAVAYRDRTSGRVLLSRSKAGVVTQEVVADGRVLDPASGTQRANLVGTSLAVAILPNGRAVIAIQDASRLRLDLAIQTPSGTFTHNALPGDGPQAWPVLTALEGGSIGLAWVELQSGRGPGGGILRTATISPGGTL